MRASRLAVVWTALNLGLLVVATAVGVWGALHAAGVRERLLAELSATARSTGVSTGRTALGPGMEVVFEDASGDAYRLVVPVEDLPDVYRASYGLVRPGDTDVLVRYDPDRPGRALLAATADARSLDGTLVAVALVGVALVPILGWARRWLRLLRAGRAPAGLYVVQALVADDDPDERTVLRWWHGLRRRTWLRITPSPDAPASQARYQRVLWEPRLATLAAPALTAVRRAGPDALTVVTVDGVAVVPLGPARRRPPGGVLRPAVVRPFSWNGVVRPALPLVAAVTVVAVRGVLLEVSREGLPGTAGLPVLVVVLALLTVGWLWSGPVPLLDRTRQEAPVTG